MKTRLIIEKHGLISRILITDETRVNSLNIERMPRRLDRNVVRVLHTNVYLVLGMCY